MLGIVGILGCVAVAAVCVSGVAAAVSIGLSVKASEDAKDAAKKQEQLQREANTKAENREKATSVLNDKITAKNLLQARQQIGDSIAYSKLMTERTQRETAKAHQDFAQEKVDSTKTAAAYALGKPAAQA